jgi:hypothetical protein
MAGLEWSMSQCTSDLRFTFNSFFRRVRKAKKEVDGGRLASQTKFVKTTGGGSGQAVLKVILLFDYQC